MNAEDLFKRGEAHFVKKGSARDYRRAWTWYERAGRAGSAKAIARMGYMLAAGLGVEKDVLASREMSQKAANLGDTEGMYQLGVHLQGESWEAGWKWIVRAANGGHAQACYVVAEHYLHSRHLDDRAIEKSLDWFMRAVELGHGDACTYLADLLVLGIGGRRDRRRARELYERAIATGEPLAVEVGQKRLAEFDRLDEIIMID